MIGFVRDDWYLIDRIGGRASLYRIGGEDAAGEPADPTRDLGVSEPETLREMRDAARAYYYVANDMILNRRAGVEAYRTSGLHTRDMDENAADAGSPSPTSGPSPSETPDRPPGDGPFTEGWVYPGQPGGKMKRSCLDVCDVP
jgi:hypothetical protein